MSRRVARETTMKFLYQFDLLKLVNEEKEYQIEEFFNQIKEEQPSLPVYLLDESNIELSAALDPKNTNMHISELDEEYIRKILTDIDSKREEIDELISKYSKGWKLNRIPFVDAAILRLAIYEMHYCDDIPISVSINESVELAKKYCADASAPFINAVLGSISRAE